MNSDIVQSIVARCLTQPDFLLAARKRCDVQSSTLGEPEDIAAELIGPTELDQLIQFRGFITKIKHNSLRKYIPATMGLMGAQGIELAFFCAFSPQYVLARSGGPLDTALHLDLFGKALMSFLNEEKKSIATSISEVFTHESRLYYFGNKESEPVRTDYMDWQGNMHFSEYTVDVLKICQKLSARNFVLDDIKEHAHCLAYWVPDVSRDVTMFEVDMVTAAIFSALKTGASPDEVMRSLAKIGLSNIDMRSIRAVVFEAAKLGFVKLHGAWIQ